MNLKLTNDDNQKSIEDAAVALMSVKNANGEYILNIEDQARYVIDALSEAEISFGTFLDKVNNQRIQKNMQTLQNLHKGINRKNP